MRVLGTVAQTRPENVSSSRCKSSTEAWHADVTAGCATLNKSSMVGGEFNLTRADIGFHYRVRADYIHRGIDDSYLSNDSAWL